MGIVRNIVGRLHVGRTDQDVVLFVVGKVKASAWKKMTAKEQALVVWTAIECHHENQELYRSVMRGF